MQERTDQKTPNKDTFHEVAFCYGIQNFQNHRFKTKSKNYKEKQKEKAHHIWIKYGLLGLQFTCFILLLQYHNINHTFVFI